MWVKQPNFIILHAEATVAHHKSMKYKRYTQSHGNTGTVVKYQKILLKRSYSLTILGME